MSKKRILWALSSVGYGHLFRDIPVIDKLIYMANVEIDILVPAPLYSHRILDSYNVLEDSRALKSSGVVYENVFRDKENTFDLYEFIIEDAKYHLNDCEVTKKLMERKSYNLIVADEAFWLLTGFSMGWLEKSAPFVYMAEFVGMKCMEKTPVKENFFRIKNSQFIYTKQKMDLMIYWGFLHEIPDEEFGKGLPNQLLWVKDNCYCAKPIFRLKKTGLPDKKEVKDKMGFQNGSKLFLGIASGVAKSFNLKLCELLEECFDLIRSSEKDASFIILCKDKDKTTKRDFIQYFDYLDNLLEYMWISDVVITQAGLSKIVELLSLGVPFISIPMDYHFEQEFYIGQRLKNYRNQARHLLLRELSPEILYGNIKELIGLKDAEKVKLEVDDGTEVARLIVEKFDL